MITCITLLFLHSLDIFESTKENYPSHLFIVLSVTIVFAIL